MTTAITTMTPADPAAIRSAFSRFPSGVAALCATVDGKAVALVASSFQVGVSLEPPLVLFSVQNSSTTWPTLKQAPRIGVSILGRDHDLVCRQLASKDKTVRFEGIRTHRLEDDEIYLDDAAVWMECAVWSEMPAGDHHIVVLEVLSLRSHDEVEPLVFHGSTFRGLA